MDQGQIFLLQLSLGHKGGESGGGLFVPGENHKPAHVLIQPMDGEKFPAQSLPQKLGHLLFRVHAYRLDADHKILILRDDFHKIRPF